MDTDYLISTEINDSITTLRKKTIQQFIESFQTQESSGKIIDQFFCLSSSRLLNDSLSELSRFYRRVFNRSLHNIFESASIRDIRIEYFSYPEFQIEQESKEILFDNKKHLVSGHHKFFSLYDVIILKFFSRQGIKYFPILFDKDLIRSISPCSETLSGSEMTYTFWLPE